MNGADPGGDGEGSRKRERHPARAAWRGNEDGRLEQCESTERQRRFAVVVGAIDRQRADDRRRQAQPRPKRAGDDDRGADDRQDRDQPA
jgi:hypothetical protein